MKTQKLYFENKDLTSNDAKPVLWAVLQKEVDFHLWRYVAERQRIINPNSKRNEARS